MHFGEGYPAGPATAAQESWGRPARPAAATPRRQNGFMLREVQRRDTPGPFRYGDAINHTSTDSGGTALWLEAPWFPEQMTSGGYGSFPGAEEDFTVTARPDKGEPLPLRWSVLPTRRGADKMLCAVLPAGYPDTVTHFDVAVRDRNGNKARWRLVDLPRPTPLIPRPIRVVEQVRAAGVLVKASAWRYKSVPAVPDTRREERIHGRLEASGTPRPAGEWELTAEGGIGQWETEPIERPDAFAARPALAGWGMAFRDGIPPSLPVFVRASYPAATRYARVRGALRRFATYKETVTFDNLEVRPEPGRTPPRTATTPPPQRAFLAVTKTAKRTTPSGFTVLLLPGSASDRPDYSGPEPGVGGTVTLLVRPGPQIEALPDSPLFQKHRKPVSVRLRVAPPYRTRAASLNATGGPWRLFLPEAKTAKPLTVVVTQRVELESRPLEFTVPVAIRDPRQPGGPLYGRIASPVPTPLSSPPQEPKPARVDAATPHRQKGFTLLAAQIAAPDGSFRHENTRFGSGDVDAIGLWVRPDVPLEPPMEGSVRPFSGMYAATGRASTGDTFPLEVLSFGGSTFREPRLLVRIPSGYPETFRHIDVTLSDPAQETRKARWRVTNLPRPRHALKPPVALKGSVAVAGVTVTARAWRHRFPVGPPSQSERERVLIQLKGAMRPTQAARWDLGHTGVIAEWAAGARPTVGTAFRPFTDQGVAVLVTDARLAYPRQNRFVRVQGTLRERDTLDETATFRALRLKRQGDRTLLVVEKSRSVKTASGLTVTLPVQNTGDGSGETFQSGPSGLVRVRLEVTPPGGDWNASSLSKKHGKPVQVLLSGEDRRRGFSDGLFFGGAGPHGQTLYLRLPENAGTTLESLTIQVRQQVEIRMLPVELTVKIGDAPPDDWPPGRSGPVSIF